MEDDQTPQSLPITNVTSVWRLVGEDRQLPTLVVTRTYEREVPYGKLVLVVITRGEVIATSMVLVPYHDIIVNAATPIVG